MTQYQLAHTLMPLYAITKERTRQIAKDLGLIVAEKKDSQEICFVPDNGYASFIEGISGKSPEGDFVFDGKVVGRHKGIIHYTVGQRKGLGIALGEPVYVTKIDPSSNRIYLGVEGSQLKDELTASNVNFIPFDTLSEPIGCSAKIRYNSKAAPCTVFPEGDGVRVVFDTPQRAPAPGQSVVFYNENLVLGGGTINA